MILAGDIGGTNTRLAYFEDHAGLPRPVRIEVYPSKAHTSLEQIIDRFLATHRHPIDGAGFGIAGPVIDGVCRTPNLPWVVQSSHLAKKLGLDRVDLVNDLHANAAGIALLEPADLVTLQPGKPQPRGNAALISAGTGLGEAGVYRHGDRVDPFASEGGHTDFAPCNELQMHLLTHLMRTYPHVSYERVLSGPGLVNVYRFLVDTGRHEEPPWLTEQFKTNDPAAAITKSALDGTCDACVAALDLFVSIYGAEAGNLALTVLATGGLYVGGGIAPRIIDKLKGPRFLEAFLAKGRMRPLLETVPVKVIINDKTALLGAAKVTWDRLDAAGR